MQGYSHLMRSRWLLLSIWICFLLRGWFYASLFPLWEGYDEFAHFGVVRAMATKGLLLVPRDQAGPRDVEESLALAPIPWEVRSWEVLRSSLTEDAYWKLPPEERQAREARLRNLPLAWAREDSTHGISAYEALQPPLAYWLMAPVLYALRGAGLLAQVIWLRWIGVAIASLAIPLTFRIALAVARSEAAALGCSAVVALMPGFAINAARVSNEPLAILLFSLLVWLGIGVLNRPPDVRSAAALGAVLGLGLLTKAYFLAALPPVFLLLLYKWRKAWAPLVTALSVAAAIAGWWYVRNLVITGTLTGLAEPVMLRGRGMTAELAAVPHVPWLHAVDAILVSHLYFCGWSSLTVRSWIYHFFYAIVLLAALGLIAQLRRGAVVWLADVYAFFWLGQFYNVVLQYLTKGLAASMGWYLYAVVASEVPLTAAAFGRWSTWAASLGAVLFGALDLYGMHWLAIPYYTGLIAHRANGALAAMHVSQVRAIGVSALFERMAVNKPLSSHLLIVLWILYLAGTIAPMFAALLSAARGDKR